MKKLNKLFICVLTFLITVLYSGLPVKAEEQYTVTFDPNDGTMETIKTVTKTSGSTYGYLAGEGKHIASESDNEMLGYANYDFGSAITISTKVSLDNFNNDCQTWFNNFEAGGFGFEYKKEDDCFNFEVYTNGAYHDVYIKRHFKEKKAFWITGVYDASADRMDVYINGELQTPYKSSHPSSKGNIKVSAAQLSDTGNPKAPSGYDENTQFYGTLYKAGLWTTAMTQEQISDMVNNDYINSAALINLDYTPRRVGYSFDGWYEDVNNPNTKITSTAKITKNTTLHAKWTAHSYTVQYKPNGATSGTVADTTHFYNDDSTLAINSFQRTGYVFGGWNTKPDGSGKTYYSGQKASNLTDKDGATVTLYAVWAPDADVFNFTIPTEVKATADSSGNISGDIQFSTTTEKRRWVDVSISSENDFSLVDKEDTNNKINYSLSETSFKVEPQYTDSDSKNYVKDITVSGKDKKIAGEYTDKVNFNISSYYETRTITLDCNGGNVNGQSELQYTVKDGSSYGQLPVPSKSGYQFVGWKDENDNTIYSGSIVLPETEKLTAKFLPSISILVYWKVNNQEAQNLNSIGTVDIYRNGQLYSKNCSTTLLWNSLGFLEGDKITFKNFKLNNGFKITKSENEISGYTVQKDSNGNITEINVTASKQNSGRRLIMDVQKTTELQSLLNDSKAVALYFDSDIPEYNIDVLGNLTIFKSKASAYLKDETLHIFNPDGGKVVAPADSTSLFEYTTVTDFDASNLDVSEVVYANYMFTQCTMSSLNMKGWSTGKFKDCNSMFKNCINLKHIDFSSWDTSSILTFYDFLFGCSSLTEVDVSNFNTSNCTSLFRMFCTYGNLKHIIGLENFDTKKCLNFAGMFQSSGLETVDVSSFDTSNATRINYMFGGNYSLKEIIGLENFVTDKILDMNCLFTGDASLTELNLSSFSSKSLKNTKDMFSYCANLKKIYTTANFNMPASIESNNMFYRCTSLVGGAGTVYDPTFIDATPAHIDGGSENPGYFTDIKDKPAESVADQTTSDETAIDVSTAGDYIEDESQEQQI